MKLKTKIVKRWKAETPKVYKRIRNSALTVIAAIPVLAGISNMAPNINTPEFFSKYSWHVEAAALFISGGCQLTKKKEDEDK